MILEANICKKTNFDKAPHLWSTIFFLLLKTQNLSNVKFNNAVIVVAKNQESRLPSPRLLLEKDVKASMLTPPKS